VVVGRLARPRWLLVAWVVAAGLITAACVVVYAAAQQAGRIGADDVPRALAQRSAALLAAGRSPQAVAQGPAVDLATDASPFVTVYGTDHAVLASTATLDGAVPAVPVGVLDHASTVGGGRVTWQPAAGVREAVVTQRWTSPSGSGVVVAGVGLAATEHRAQQVLLLAGVAWLVGLLVVTGVVVGLSRLPARRVV
jgi:hypothetical protein